MINILALKQKLKHSRIVVFIWNLTHKPKPMKKMSWGDGNPDKTFYVIGRADMIGGGWSLIVQILMHMAYALEKGYIPVIDMLNYRNQYIKENEFKIVNVWERFFEQPVGYTLNDIQNSKNIIINSSERCPDLKYYIDLGSNFWDDDVKINLMRSIFSSYIRYTEFTKKYLEDETQKIFKGKRNVIGVLCRGTDYLLNKPAGHEVQPDPKVVLADVKSEFNKGTYDAIFLATEDQDVLDDFKDEFGESLLYIDQSRVSKKEMKGDKWLSSVRENNHPNEDKDLAFLSYFSATYILAKCKCFFAGRNYGSKGVLLFSNRFEFVKIYNLGKY